MKKEVRITIERQLTDANAKAMYGILSVEDRKYMTCERMWNDNIPGESAVPTGFYVLEPHDGSKYKETFALVGATVSHVSSPGIPRSACVIHWEDDGRFLQGCVSVGDHIEHYPDRDSKLIGDKVPELLKFLRGFEKIYLTITEN